ncbi:MAG: hypothetical protein VR64_00515 [Desulfatitalea sp. BRH_c12]|nr:MAG: hypothetical protein VR64_00515 [Desulfatitalea sp. BRH_c12]
MGKGHFAMNFRILCALCLAFFFPATIVGYAVSAQVEATDRYLVRYNTGEIHDKESGLEWFAGPDKPMSWAQAQKWVSSLGGGWRMPTRRELDRLHYNGAIQITPLLPSTGYWIWAGPTHASSSKWVFRFSYGGEGWSGEAPPDGGRSIAVRKRSLYK